jgi:hypothetical protein
VSVWMSILLNDNVFIALIRLISHVSYVQLFVHIFTHKDVPDHYTEGWMTENFFTGGTLPSDSLLMYFNKHFGIEEHWIVNGTHYQKTLGTYIHSYHKYALSHTNVYDWKYALARSPHIIETYAHMRTHLHWYCNSYCHCYYYCCCYRGLAEADGLQEGRGNADIGARVRQGERTQVVCQLETVLHVSRVTIFMSSSQNVLSLSLPVCICI